MNIPVIDLRAVILLAGAMGALMAIVIAFLRRSYPRSIAGLGYWSAGPAVIFVSTLLFGARAILPDLFTVVIANLLLMVGITLIYFGSARFYRVTVDTRPWAIAIALVTLVTFWYALVDPRYSVRLFSVACFMAVVCGRHALLVSRHGGQAFSARFVVVVLVIEIVVLVMRALSAFAVENPDLLHASPVQTVYITSYSVALLMLTVGLVLLAADRLREELEHIASHDPLTGILTRRALLEVCTRELARCRRHDRRMSLLMLDLDHFKAINDTHGHLVGDHVLIDFVGRVQRLLRQVDSFGRFGGEEFIVLLPETEPAAAMIVAERIRQATAGASGLPAYTVSVGVAANRVDDARVDEILTRADAALYQAKADGRNCVRADA